MTLGMDRNNPGNLLPEHVPWMGLAAAQPDGGPLSFGSLGYGIRAFVKLCYTYQAEGLDTPRAFIAAFSPAAAGNPEAQYLTNVCDWTGYAPDDVMDFHDIPTMKAWARAIFRQEQGASVAATITDGQISVGISMAEGA